MHITKKEKGGDYATSIDTLVTSKEMKQVTIIT